MYIIVPVKEKTGQTINEYKGGKGTPILVTRETTRPAKGFIFKLKHKIDQKKGEIRKA
jgi:hypothetical protein